MAAIDFQSIYNCPYMPTPALLWLIIALDRNADKVYMHSELVNNYTADFFIFFVIQGKKITNPFL